MLFKLFISSAARASMSAVASLFFLLGSIMFLPQFAEYAVSGVWCFIVGSAIFLVMSVLDIVFSERS